jgi:hypothetical protein
MRTAEPITAIAPISSFEESIEKGPLIPREDVEPLLRVSAEEKLVGVEPVALVEIVEEGAE